MLAPTPSSSTLSHKHHFPLFGEVDSILRHFFPFKAMNHPAGKYELLCVLNNPPIVPCRLVLFYFLRFHL